MASTEFDVTAVSRKSAKVSPSAFFNHTNVNKLVVRAAANMMKNIFAEGEKLGVFEKGVDVASKSQPTPAFARRCAFDAAQQGATQAATAAKTLRI